MKYIKKYTLTPISYKTYRKLRSYKYETIDKGYYSQTRGEMITWKPTCYLDGSRIKFCHWGGGFTEWEKYANSLDLELGKHFVFQEQDIEHYTPAVILYLKEDEN